MLGRFVPAYFRCPYNLTETARGHLLCRITTFYKRLETPLGFHFEMETVFSYKARAFIDDVQSGLWVAALTERVVRVVATLLYEVYD